MGNSAGSLAVQSTVSSPPAPGWRRRQMSPHRCLLVNGAPLAWRSNPGHSWVIQGFKSRAEYRGLAPQPCAPAPPSVLQTPGFPCLCWPNCSWDHIVIRKKKELVWVKYNTFHHAVVSVYIFFKTQQYTAWPHIQHGDKGHCGVGREQVARVGWEDGTIQASIAAKALYHLITEQEWIRQRDNREEEKNKRVLLLRGPTVTDVSQGSAVGTALQLPVWTQLLTQATLFAIFLQTHSWPSPLDDEYAKSTSALWKGSRLPYSNTLCQCTGLYLAAIHLCHRSN